MIPMPTGTLVALAHLATDGHASSSTKRFRSPAELDVQSHFQALTQNPADVLRHIGSPFAPDKDKDVTQPQTLAA
jgi:hypothetical protein